ncbi:unnamed protein product [Trichogramma brassicae]|uniref:Uncharacterized protein n=1 Tax=Trichogramma brassicae TaxID=86971 RepID=A0A6H5IAR5_9HYME|nr:unnamed protein product [Trichogramma brassicae]
MELEWLLRSTFFGINTSEEAAAAATTTRDKMITRSEEQQRQYNEEDNRQRYCKRWRRRPPRYLLIFVALLLLLLQNNVRLAEGATATTASLLLPITDNESARENPSIISAADADAAAASGESLFVSSALPKLTFRSRDSSSNNETTTTTTTSSSNVDSRSEFTDWSDWSVCDRNCMQNRIKKCRAPSQCANSLLRVNDEVRAARKGSRRKHHHQQQYHRRKGKNELLQDDDGGGRTPQDEYGKWSKWSSCTRSCTTQRLKWCKIPGLCAKDVVRQTAYCYIEGSYCQRWIRRKIHQHYEGNSNAASSDTSNLTEDRFADLAGDDGGGSSSSNSNLTPATAASEDYSNSSPAWKCGVTRKSNKLSYFTRIIGGRPTLPGSWPWQVAVLNRYGVRSFLRWHARVSALGPDGRPLRAQAALGAHRRAQSADQRRHGDRAENTDRAGRHVPRRLRRLQDHQQHVLRGLSARPHGLVRRRQRRPPALSQSRPSRSSLDDLRHHELRRGLRQARQVRHLRQAVQLRALDQQSR